MKEYLEKGEFAPREGLAYVRRDNVALVISYKEQYCVLKWNEVNYKSLVTGGVEVGETEMEAAIRELAEETGYFDIDQIILVEEGIHAAKFYVEHKNQNRLAIYYPFLILLHSLEKGEIAEMESKEHSCVLLSEKEVREFGMFDNHMMMFNEAVKVKKKLYLK